MHQKFIERLKEQDKRFIIVTGTPQDRLQSAIKAIDQLGIIRYEKQSAK